MNSNRFSYPHPILGNFDDILPRLEDDCVVSHTTSDDKNHYYRFVLTINNQTILDLIAQKKAQYAIHYKCRSTRIEGHQYGFENILIVKIPRTEVIERIDFNLYVIAIENFTYYNPYANPIFMGNSFEIHPQDPLVFFPDQYDNLDLSYQTLRHYTSILVPVSDGGVEEKDIRIEVENEKIEVHLSPITFEKIKKINNLKYKEEVMASYVQNALMAALFSLFENDKDDIRMDGRAWVQAILKRLEEPNMPSLDDLCESAVEVVPSLVQRLLDFPMELLLNKLSNNVDSEEEDYNTTE